MSSGVHNYGRGARQLGFSVHALSKTLGPDEICSRIDAFLPQFRELVRNMSDEVRFVCIGGCWGAGRGRGGGGGDFELSSEARFRFVWVRRESAKIRHAI